MAKKGLPERLSKIVFQALGLCTLYIGISGSLKGSNTLVLILSMVLGVLIGEGLDLDRRINGLGIWIEDKCKKKGRRAFHCRRVCDSEPAVLRGRDGHCRGAAKRAFGRSRDVVYKVSFRLCGGNRICLFSRGGGAVFGGFCTHLPGGITLLAAWIAPLLSEVVVAEMTCAGSVIIIGLALNMLGLTKLKVMNFVPAIFLPVLLCLFL